MQAWQAMAAQRHQQPDGLRVCCSQAAAGARDEQASPACLREGQQVERLLAAIEAAPGCLAGRQVGEEGPAVVSGPGPDCSVKDAVGRPEETVKGGTWLGVRPEITKARPERKQQLPARAIAPPSAVSHRRNEPSSIAAARAAPAASTMLAPNRLWRSPQPPRSRHSSATKRRSRRQVQASAARARLSVVACLTMVRSTNSSMGSAGGGPHRWLQPGRGGRRQMGRGCVARSPDICITSTTHTPLDV